jgi:hypothetical protein
VSGSYVLLRSSNLQQSPSSRLYKTILPTQVLQYSSPQFYLKKLLTYCILALVAARRDPSEVQKLIDENVVGFTDNQIEVHISSGPNYPPIRVIVHEFIPANNELLAVHCAPPDISDPKPSIEEVYAPPFGLIDNNGKDRDKLRRSCREHIKVMIEHSQVFPTAASGNSAPLSCEIYEVVNRYGQSKRISGNVRSAITLK